MVGCVEHLGKYAGVVEKHCVARRRVSYGRRKEVAYC